MPVLIIALAFAWSLFWCWACVSLATAKGRSQEAWGTAGFMLGVFAFVVLLFLPAREPVEATVPVRPTDDPAGAIGALADLHARGALTDAEFTAKKRELLERM